jgi:hypothetical protein
LRIEVFTDGDGRSLVVLRGRAFSNDVLNGTFEICGVHFFASPCLLEGHSEVSDGTEHEVTSFTSHFTSFGHLSKSELVRRKLLLSISNKRGVLVIEEFRDLLHTVED